MLDCEAVIKSFELTPNASTLMEKMISELFETFGIAIFQGKAKVAKAPMELPFDHIFFTGIFAIDKIVMKAASKNLDSV
jgi:aldehyde dehydrogenase (NAD+)